MKRDTTDTTEVRIVAYRTASSMIDAAMEHARDNGWRVAVAVLDPWGAVVASGRMDGVSHIVLEIAVDKAFTATLGKSTRAFQERMASSQNLSMGVQNRSRLCAWEGGLPILRSKEQVGAIGVSGAAGPEDVACAEAALARTGFGD